MTDCFGRNIDYLRVSVTDRCNLRCRYCMPDGIDPVGRQELLSYEELLRVCRVAVHLGIVKFKLTGGEPLVRRGFMDFAARLRRLEGVSQLTLTTNGLLLSQYAEALRGVGFDGVNISLDTLRNEKYAEITGIRGARADTVRSAIALCVDTGIRVKVNAVLLAETYADILSLAGLAREMPVDVRFIELMPIGNSGGKSGVSMDCALALLRTRWPDLAPTDEKRGNGPAHYYASRTLMGRIGFIDAVSHGFCDSCNRLRLTCTGQLKPCLCYDTAEDLRTLLRTGVSDAALGAAIRRAVGEKPRAHCFGQTQAVTEHRCMSQIGG